MFSLRGCVEYHNLNIYSSVITVSLHLYSSHVPLTVFPCMFSVCSPLVLYCYVLVDHHHSHVMIGQYLFLCVLSISLYDCLCMYMYPRVHLYVCHGGVSLNHMNYIDVLYTTYGGYLLHTSSIKSLLIHLLKLYMVSAV